MPSCKAASSSAPPASRTVDPEIPPAIDEIISRCLEPDPDKRFETTVELQTAFDRLDENGKPLPIIRRLTRRGMAAAAAIVVLLLGGTFYTGTWMFAPPKAHDPVLVVIADLQNNTNDPTFDHTLEPMLRRALEDAGFISAYDRTRIRIAFGVQPPDTWDETAARELAIKQGVGVVLAGAIAPQGDGYDISLTAKETVSGNEITTAQGRAANKDQVLDAATKLVATVRTALGDETSESAQLFAMKSLSTASLDVVSALRGSGRSAIPRKVRGGAPAAIRARCNWTPILVSAIKACRRCRGILAGWRKPRSTATKRSAISMA